MRRLSPCAALLLSTVASASGFAFSADEGDHVPGVIGGAFAPLPFLPGTSTFISPLPLISVRGQQPSATAYLYDGVRLPTLFHLIAGPTFLPTGSFSAFTFERGIAPAKVRGAAGGVISVFAPASVDPGVHGAASLDLLGLSTTNSWSSQDGGSSVALGAGVLWSPLLYTRAFNRSLEADLFSYLGRVDTRVGQGSVRLLALGASDTVGNRSATEVVGAGFGLHRVDGRFRQPLRDGDLELGMTFGIDTVAAELGGAVSRATAFAEVTTLSTRLSWTGLAFGFADVSVGADGERKTADLEQGSRTIPPAIEGAEDAGPITSNSRTRIAQASVFGGWIDIGVGDPDWRWTLGARVDSYHPGVGSPLFAVDPRATARKRLNDQLVLTVGAGLTHLPPTHLIPLPPADLASLRFGLQELVQTNVELTYQPRADAALSVELFANPVNRAVELSPLDRNFLQTVKASEGAAFSPQITTGLDLGGEVTLRRLYAGDFFGWASYSYLRSRRELRFPTRNEFGEPSGSKLAELQPNWTQAHVANFVLGRSMGAWTVSGALHLHSGALEAGGLSSFTQRPGEDRLRAGPRWVEQDLGSVDTLPPFFRADLHIAREFRAGPLVLEASLDVQNISFSREVAKYSYSDEADSLEARAAGDIRLVRTPAGSGVPALPLPMLAVKARY